MGTISTFFVVSAGDYIATARACDLPLPPKHAVNRGIAMEGLATVVSGFVGAAHGTSTYGRAVGLIALTGVSCAVPLRDIILSTWSAGHRTQVPPLL